MVSKVFEKHVNNRLVNHHLIYLRLLTGFDILVFFTNLRLMEFLVRYLALFRHSSLFDGFGGRGWGSVWMGSLHKNIQLMLFNDLTGDVVSNIAIYADDTISILNVIKYVICGNN